MRLHFDFTIDVDLDNTAEVVRLDFSAVQDLIHLMDHLGYRSRLAGVCDVVPEDGSDLTDWINSVPARNLAPHQCTHAPAHTCYSGGGAHVFEPEPF